MLQYGRTERRKNHDLTECPGTQKRSLKFTKKFEIVPHLSISDSQKLAKNLSSTALRKLPHPKPIK